MEILLSTRHLFAGIVAVVSVVTIFALVWTGPHLFAKRAGDGQELQVQSTGVLREAELCEVSGIARARGTADAWWMHNDSGDSPRIFLVSHNAQLLQTWELAGAAARDWEDMSAFSTAADKHYLLMGDIGDNAASRSQCELYLIVEPELSQTKTPNGQQPKSADIVSRIDFCYEDGPRNCEAMAVDTRARCVWFVEKLSPGAISKARAGVYCLDLSPFVPEWQSEDITLKVDTRLAASVENGKIEKGRLATARRVGEVPLSHVTAMDINDGGDRLIIRDYYQARMWQRAEDQTWKQCLRGELPPALQLPLEPQGEAIAFTADGLSVMTISELTYQPLWQVQLPEASPRPVTVKQSGESSTRLQGNDKKLVLPGEVFEVDDRAAFIFWPAVEKQQQPQPWVFYAPTLAAYPDEHEKWMHQQFLDAGIAVAGIDVGEAYGNPKSRQTFDVFYEHMVGQRRFAKKPVLLGRSRGGLWVASWAADHPERFAGLAGIYPVFDWQTYPGVDKAAAAYGVLSEELVSKAAEWNPIARIGKLAEAGIPVYLIHGDQDNVVPLEPNSQAFAKVYEVAGKSDKINLEVVAGQGHNYWEGFFRSQNLVDFVIRHAK